MRFARVLVAAVLLSTIVAVPSAGADVPTCTATGEPFPELLAFERVTDFTSAEGWRVETLVSGRFLNGNPEQAVVNYIQSPFAPRNPVFTIDRQLAGQHRTTLAFGTVPQGLPTGNYEVFNVVLVDASGCISLYYQLDNTVTFQEPGTSNIDETHTFDFASHGLELVDPESVPPDPFTWTPAQKYINALVELFLNRSADRTEILAADQTLATSGRLAAAQQLASSEEWAGEVIDGIYQDALDRDPDNAGRAFWVDRLLTDGRTRDIAISIYGSPEAFDRAGGTAEEFIDALYNRILGRNPDAGGQAFWLDQLNSGQAEPWQIVASFWESIEFRNQRVERVYQQVLNRPADPSGLEHWSERLLIDDDVTLAALLASSDEFYNGAT